MGARVRVLILTNIPAPYRLPVFEALGEHVDLTVMFCRGQDDDRLWQADLALKRVCYKVLPWQSVRMPGSITITWNRGLADHLRESSYDVYIAGENFDTLFSVLALHREARRQRKPFVIWSESIDTDYASGTLVSNAYRRWLYRRTDAFIAYGDRAKTYLVRRGAPEGNMTLGYQVVPDELIPHSDVTKKDLELAGKTIALYVGYFVERKGLCHLIQAFATVAGENDVLALMGSGPEEGRLRAIAGDDPRIIFPGYLEGKAKSDWYACADLFVLPTLHDPWGLVVNEAMAFGLPIVVTDAAGCADLVLDNGIVVRPGDTDSLGSALLKLLRDPELRHAMGQRSRRIIADYTVEAACHAFLGAIHGARSAYPS